MLYQQISAGLIQAVAENIPCPRGDRDVFARLSFSLGGGEALLVTGRNRPRKSSFLRLIAALLRAMGFKARVTPKGPDRGRDVIASPDGLGLQQPRIVAEVKHRPRESMGSNPVRSFISGSSFARFKM